MVLNVKAFLEKNGEVKGEIRRFQVQQTNTAEMYRLLVAKVADVFSMPENGFKMFWQDTDGDFVTFSSTVEMTEAIHHSTDGILRIYVRRTTEQTDSAPKEDKGGEKSEEEKVHHPGVVCDGCEGSIYGPRYKCMSCYDYDLCEACELKGIHPEHDKIKMLRPQASRPAPPHYLRWLEGIMKTHGQCPAGGATAAGQSTSTNNGAESSTGPQSQEGPSSGEDYTQYLNSIGANIAAFLDPFGVDVSYEVRHGDGEKKRGHFKSKGTGRSQQSGGPQPFWCYGSTFNTGGCTRMPQAARPSTSTEGEKPAEKPAAAKPAEKPAAAKPAEKPAETCASEELRPEADAEEVEMTMEEAAVLNSQNAQRSKDASPTGSNDDDWTMLNDAEPTTDGEGASGSESVPCDGLYPNLKVAQAVDMMKAMGFNDDGGWLTRLLETTDGDIAQALDTLKLGAQQASRLA